MKKLFVLMAVLAVSATVASAQQWGVGGRIGSGFQGVGQYVFSNDNYVEARLGMDWVYGGGICADFTATYNWRVAKFNWTSSGEWFFDAGAGLYVGGRAHVAFVGVAGVAKLGYTFDNIPLSLAFDWTPSFGPGIFYTKKQTISGGGIIPDITIGGTTATFNERALCNFGISAVYKF